MAISESWAESLKTFGVGSSNAGKGTYSGLARPSGLAASVGATNVTSLSVEPVASLQQLVVARQRSYDPLSPHSLS